MSVEEALCHPYVAAYHDAEDEPAAPSIDPEYFQFEGESLSSLVNILTDSHLSYSAQGATIERPAQRPAL